MTTSPIVPDDVAAVTRTWTEAQRNSYMHTMRRTLARERSLTRCRNAAELAASVEPGYRITPALALIADALEDAITQPGRNLIVTTPPQEGKSTLCAVWATVRALQHNPDCRVILATYAEGLAEEHSRAARAVIESHGTSAKDPLGEPLPDRLGLELSPDKAAATRWTLRGFRGGMVAAGVNSTITGRAADLFIIDDPYKNSQEADSAAHRKKVSDWIRSVAFTRLSPDASVILVQTRWHPKDIAGELLAEEEELPESDRSWRYINVPALSAPGVPDALGRTVMGEVMVSARGRTAAHFLRTRRNVGERVFWALYQGRPEPPEGALFRRAWFDKYRLPLLPPPGAVAVVGVDPAETGEHDEAGVVVGTLTDSGQVALVEDVSGRMTSREWSRAAVLAAVRHGASEIAVECYTAGTTYADIVEGTLAAVAEEAARLAAAGAAPVVDGVDCAPMLSPGFGVRVHQWRGKGDAVIRSAALRQAVETGACRVAGDGLGTLEDQACGWQLGQHQPDRVAAAVIVHDRLTYGAGLTVQLPDFRAAQQATGRNPWLRRRIGS